MPTQEKIPCITRKINVTPLTVLKEIERYWCDRHYPLNELIAGLPVKEFGKGFTVGDLIRLAIERAGI